MAILSDPSTASAADGAVLRLSVSLMADRIGRTYDAPIAPDEVIDAPDPVDRSAASLARDPAVIAASRWLSEQAECRAR